MIQKILIIDDSQTIRRTAEVLLKKEGYEIRCAKDGFEALSIITGYQPDIIFLDIMMPRLDGYQTCTLIKTNVKYKHIPIILLSSKDGLLDKAKGKISGASFYLTKPFLKDELLDVIQRCQNNMEL